LAWSAMGRRSVDQSERRGVTAPKHQPITARVDRRPLLILKVPDPHVTAAHPAAEAERLAPHERDVFKCHENVRHASGPVVAEGNGRLKLKKRTRRSCVTPVR